MTLEIYPSTDQESMLSWNIANLPHIGDGNEHDWKMRLVSQWSNTDLIDLPVVGYLNIFTNDRYTRVTFSTLFQDLALRHVNGIYEAELYNETFGLSYKQLVKLITSPGGSTGTKPYISDNEDREAIVYYKPEY